MYYFQIQAGVFVDGDIVEADYPLHASCEIGWQDAGGLQQRKRIATFLRGSKAALVTTYIARSMAVSQAR